MEKIVTINNESRKPYIKPEILHELVLETRAGSPNSSVPEPLREILRNGG